MDPALPCSAEGGESALGGALVHCAHSGVADHLGGQSATVPIM